MAEYTRADRIKTIKSLADGVVRATQERGVPLIHQLPRGRLFSWPYAKLTVPLAEHLEHIKGSIEDSERINGLAKKAGVLVTSAGIAKDAILEKSPFEIGVVDDNAKKGIQLSLRGVIYKVTVSAEGSTSTAQEMVLDEGGDLEGESPEDLETLEAGLEDSLGRSLVEIGYKRPPDLSSVS